MLGILTDSNNQNLTADDQLLIAALIELNIPYQTVNWNLSLPSPEVTHLLIRSPWDYYHAPLKFLAYLENCENRGVQILNNTSIVKWNYTKHYLKELKEKGLNTVDSYFVSPISDISQLQVELTKMGWHEVVIKPAISGSSYLTFKTQPTNTEFFAQAEKILTHGDLLAQPFLSSIKDSGEISLIYFNNSQPEFSHAVHKKPKSGDFRVQNDFGGLSVHYTPSDSLKKLGFDIIEKLPSDWLYLRIDLVDCDNIPLISEIELIEPALYFIQYPPAAKKLAQIIKEKRFY